MGFGVVVICIILFGIAWVIFVFWGCWFVGVVCIDGVEIPFVCVWVVF